MELLEFESEQACPKVLPAGWRELRDYRGAFCDAYGLRVLLGVERHDDGRRWLHVSVSKSGRIPNWDELRAVKDLFIGREKKAIQILPPESEYVNICENCLHLWSCLDDDGIPDFRRGGQL